MFSCLRSIVRHQSTRFRPALAAASFSSSVSRKNKPSAEYQELVGILMEEGKKGENNEGGDETVGKSFMSNGEEGTYARRHKIRGFSRNVLLHATEFSRDRRVLKTFRRRSKPWDLGPANKVARFRDVFHRMEIDPVRECMNATLLSSFVTTMGHINKRARTQLTMKSQKRIAKAIKRAKMMGIMPIHSRADYGLVRFPK